MLTDYPNLTIREANETILNIWNPFFLPRVYLVDRHNRIGWMQPAVLSWQAALEAAKSEVSNEKSSKGPRNS